VKIDIDLRIEIYIYIYLYIYLYISFVKNILCVGVLNYCCLVLLYSNHGASALVQTVGTGLRPVGIRLYAAKVNKKILTILPLFILPRVDEGLIRTPGFIPLF